MILLLTVGVKFSGYYLVSCWNRIIICKKLTVRMCSFSFLWGSIIINSNLTFKKKNLLVRFYIFQYKIKTRASASSLKHVGVSLTHSNNGLDHTMGNIILFLFSCTMHSNNIVNLTSADTDDMRLSYCSGTT